MERVNLIEELMVSEADHAAGVLICGDHEPFVSRPSVGALGLGKSVQSLGAISFQVEVLPDQARDQRTFFVSALAAIAIEPVEFIIAEQDSNFAGDFSSHGATPQ